jgi:hypothetical protein
MQDEGFEKTAKEGLKISTLGMEKTLISFCSGKSPPLYALSFIDDPHQPPAGAPGNGSSLRLQINGGLTLAPDPSRAPPDTVALDVRGRVCAEGWMGRPWEGGASAKPALADGKWHPVTEDLQGCSAFDVMAGVGVRDTARFALLHAVAMNTFNPAPFDNFLGLKKRIRKQDAFYHRRGDRLDLRWAPVDSRARDASQKYGRDAWYRLEIRTRTPYPKDKGEYPAIKAYVTSLWFDSMVPPAVASGGSARP